MIRIPFVLPLFHAIALAAVIARGAEKSRVVPAVEEPFRGSFVSGDIPGTLRFAADGAAREIAAADLAWWGKFAEPAAGSHIMLSGGGLIVADGIWIEKEQLRANSASLGKIGLPLELVAGVLFVPPGDRAALDPWTARLSAATQSDRIWLDNGDTLAGTIVGLDEPRKQSRSLALQTETGVSQLPADKIVAISLNSTLAEKPRAAGLRSLVGLSDGSRVTAIELTANKNTARIKLAGGASLSSSTDALVALQPLGGRVIYLSDLKPASYRHIPFLEMAWPYQADASVLGSTLRAGDQIFAKGLGMHSPSRISFDLDGSWRQFRAEAAVDAEAGTRGSVTFRVFTDDGSGNWQQQAKTEIVRGGDPPLPIAVDLAGVKRLSLLVDFADRGDELDHADWLNARLVR
jgi:hypothetical protein